jgi:hypothetical protein
MQVPSLGMATVALEYGTAKKYLKLNIEQAQQKDLN